jgi:predicted amidohydrolase
VICADVYSELPARQLRAAYAELLVSTAAWWPGQWGPNGEWEARTLDTGVPLIVCNRSGRGQESRPLVVAGPPGIQRRVEQAMEVLFPGSVRASRRFTVDFLELPSESRPPSERPR